ncbi:MAG: hypothetical protein ACLQK4_05845 [Acidimicrobiales bacterium]
MALSGMANGPPELRGLLSGASEGARAARASHRSGLRRAAAVATAGVLLGLVACDVWVAGVRGWWDRHSFTSSVVSSILVLGVTVLILDEVLARRQRKERAVSVAVQAVIVYGQARQSCDAVEAIATASAGGDGAEIDVPQVDARDEVRILASMILVASPALFDDPEARLFLEKVQRLAATMYGALARHKISPGAPTGDDDGTVARLRACRSQLDASVRPLAARLTDKGGAPLDALADLATRRPEPTEAPAQTALGGEGGPRPD